MYAGTLTFLRPLKQAKAMPPVEAALVARLTEECDIRISAKDVVIPRAASSEEGQMQLAF